MKKHFNVFMAFPMLLFFITPSDTQCRVKKLSTLLMWKNGGDGGEGMERRNRAIS
jgi:hypothetical protein